MAEYVSGYDLLRKYAPRKPGVGDHTPERFAPHELRTDGTRIDLSPNQWEDARINEALHHELYRDVGEA